MRVSVPVGLPHPSVLVLPVSLPPPVSAILHIAETGTESGGGGGRSGHEAALRELARYSPCIFPPPPLHRSVWSRSQPRLCVCVCGVLYIVEGYADEDREERGRDGRVSGKGGDHLYPTPWAAVLFWRPFFCFTRWKQTDCPCLVSVASHCYCPHASMPASLPHPLALFRFSGFHCGQRPACSVRF